MIQKDKMLIDAHVHTLASGHAYSSLYEVAENAKEKGLQAIFVAEHGPAMEGTVHDYYYHNYCTVPRQYKGVRLFMGCEANILDNKGTIDLSERAVQECDIIIASLHDRCIQAGSKEENTKAIINVMKNPAISIIGHPDDSRFPLDYQEIVKAAEYNNVLLEANNSSLLGNCYRQDTKRNIIKYLSLCMKYNVKISLGSDAHICDNVGSLSEIILLLNKMEFPSELIITQNISQFETYLITKMNKNK